MLVVIQHTVYSKYTYLNGGFGSTVDRVYQTAVLQYGIRFQLE